MISNQKPITWRNLEPDYLFFSKQDLFQSLGFIDGIVLCHLAKNGLIVLIKKSVRRKIQKHLIQKKIEMGGLLIGQVFLINNNNSKYYVSIVTNSIESINNEATSVSVKLGTDVWSLARNSLSKGSNIIGWYHSHPGFGAFFSSTDKRTQKGFFNQTFQVGLVVDPFRKEEKWFFGKNSDPVHHVFRIK